MEVINLRLGYSQEEYKKKNLMKIKILSSASQDLIDGYWFYEKYHRLLSKRFPFAVYYRVEDQTALVYAVLDCRRSPAWIRKKLG